VSARLLVRSSTEQKRVSLRRWCCAVGGSRAAGVTAAVAAAAPVPAANLSKLLHGRGISNARRPPRTASSATAGLRRPLLGDALAVSVALNVP